MATFEVFDISGKKVGQQDLDDAIFAAPIRPYLHTEVVHWQRACARAGTQSALTKGEVSGSVKKPFPQKGRGMARQGTLKNPHQIGGGVTFAPKPRDYSYSLPKAKKRAALTSVLSARVQEGRFRLLDTLQLAEIKTKQVCDFLKNFEFEGCLFVDEENNNLRLSARNHTTTKYLHQDGVNVLDVLRYPTLVMTVAAAKNIEKRLLG